MAAVAAPFMAWQDSWQVGVQVIDAQHKKLVSLLNDLYEAMKTGRGSALLGETLNDLVSYTRSHFAAEEQLMQMHGYPDFASHKREHEKLTTQVLDFQHQFSEGTATLSIEIMQFLSSWLQNHILGTDKKYAPFLNAKGVR